MDEFMIAGQCAPISQGDSAIGMNALHTITISPLVTVARMTIADWPSVAVGHHRKAERFRLANRDPVELPV
jgi:hypothetical protein